MASNRIEGGQDLSFLVPMKPDGDGRQHDLPGGVEVIGTYTGGYAGLCATNPTPGTTPGWVANTPRRIMAARIRGYRPPTGDSKPAYACEELGLGWQSTGDQPTPLDTSYVFGDLVYMEIPDEALAEDTANERRRAAQIRGGTDGSGYVQGATEEEVLAAQGRGPRFTVGPHGTFTVNENGRVEHWASEGPGAGHKPKRGIRR